ncbi:helicase-like transcription factor CHR28 isoform X1 [Olea europaea subsp. europaea]|uniref:Helicase-like transcription factor CHR28 isoform X1 n=1 Tax=Olea europaea subsp. europaea TaxID=158383 RepID=A0A8S0U5F6_OLEEU|nr:helicase-like transcription factor CHR28 isoform X1 [Olea europaea subsp. europaea]
MVIAFLDSKLLYHVWSTRRQACHAVLGLGKTISTIALILKERSSTSKASKVNKEQCKIETLNLDEVGVVSEIHQPKQEAKVDGYSTTGGKTNMQAKGRPPARTLIVCVGQVLFDSAGEVRRCAYDIFNCEHGGSKQPLVNKEEDETESESTFYGRKRNYVETKKSSNSRKGKKGIDNGLLVTISGPLAKVGWFWVVLDEAQSIRNHRTQTARACWELHAKRRCQKPKGWVQKATSNAKDYNVASNQRIHRKMLL